MMAEPRRLLADANAPAHASALLRSLSAPLAPSAEKQVALGRQLAALASPVPLAPVGAALWLKGAFVVGALGFAGAVVWAVRPPATGPVAASAALVAAPLPSPVVPTEPTEPATPSDLVPEADAPRPEPSPVNVPGSAARPKPSARDHLADEEALLEQARRLAGSSPGQALGLLQQYQRRFPAGQLTAERMFLSVDVFTRLGKSAAARKQADALMRAFPGSVYAAQVKARSSNP